MGVRGIEVYWGFAWRVLVVLWVLDEGFSVELVRCLEYRGMCLGYLFG